MKVDNLLAQYLYQYKKLSLTGIGIFTLDDSAVMSDENAKTKAPIEGISFLSRQIGQPDDSLVEYIKTQTGKMKALALADLDSYTMLAHQFLNIGKPFYLEGIGTLQKNRDGSFHFNPGTSIAVSKPEETDAKKKSGPVDEGKTVEESSGKDYRGLVLALGIIATLAVIAWGGYYLYNKNADSGNPAESNVRVVSDSQMTKNISPDTATHPSGLSQTTPPAATTPAAATAPAPTTPASGYKFILETPHKKRALYRYENIKDSRLVEDFDSKVQMETQDSVTFKIFIVLPCAPADTTHYKELLNAWYYGTGDIKVKIEH